MWIIFGGKINEEMWVASVEMWGFNSISLRGVTEKICGANCHR